MKTGWRCIGATYYLGYCGKSLNGIQEVVGSISFGSIKTCKGLEGSPSKPFFVGYTKEYTNEIGWILGIVRLSLPRTCPFQKRRLVVQQSKLTSVVSGGRVCKDPFLGPSKNRDFRSVGGGCSEGRGCLPPLWALPKNDGRPLLPAGPRMEDFAAPWIMLQGVESSKSRSCDRGDDANPPRGLSAGPLLEVANDLLQFARQVHNVAYRLHGSGDPFRSLGGNYLDFTG